MSEAVFNQAIAAFQSGNAPQAEQLCLALLKADARNFGGLHLMGLARFQMGRIPAAIEALQGALAIDPRSAPAWSSLGLIQASAGLSEAALASFERALSLAPPQAEILVNLGNVLMEMDRPAEALKRFDTALWLKPDMLEALVGRSNAHRALGDHEKALADTDRALALSPLNPQVLHNRALALSGLGRHQEALETTDRALSVRPNAASTHSNRADALLALKRHKEALEACDRALALAPRLPEALCNRGVALLALQRQEEAMAAFDAALGADATLPEAHAGKSEALRLAQRFPQALASLDRALAARPASAGWLRNRGELLAELLRFDEALSSFDASAAREKDNADTGFNKSLVLLLQGDFAHGLPLYEERKRIDPPRGVRPYPQPQWLGGESVAGKSVFVHYEQGLGDVIMFSRFVAPLAAMGADVVLEVPPRMKALFEGFVPPCEIVTAPPPAFDFHVAMASLMLALKLDSNAIPAPVPYLRADPARVESWAARLGRDGFRIGIAWQGAKIPADLGRSFALSQLAGIAALPGVRLISLQKGDGAEQLQESGLKVESLGEDLDRDGAFVDTAAVMASLDLVISSDTAIAHLAGALGRPLWLALRHKPDWRWGLEGETSPWYPSAVLFRQASPGDWGPVFAAMQARLAANPALKP